MGDIGIFVKLIDEEAKEFTLLAHEEDRSYANLAGIAIRYYLQARKRLTKPDGKDKDVS